MSTYALGDIQGCYDQMRRLLDKIEFDPAEDRLWLVGDLVNRGPNNIDTLRFVRDLGDAATTVLGNHDLHFLAVYEGQHRSMRHDTLSDLPRSSEVDDLAAWLRALPLLHHDKKLNYTMVHAGIPPTWGLKQAKKRAREVEKVLRSSDYVRFLKAMYGNRPANWHPGLKGMDRLRVITNYFTRLRYCKRNGRMELTVKEKTGPKGYRPWFKHKRPNHKGLRIVFGHWAALNGKTGRQRDVFAIDTGCVWGRSLTALCLETQKLTVVKR